MYSMESADKFDLNAKNDVKFTINDKGDKVLITFWKDCVLIF